MLFVSSLLLACLLVARAAGQSAPDGPQPTATKIGLAPHERPACQLPVQRRHLAPASLGAAELQDSNTTGLLGTPTTRSRPPGPPARKHLDSSERLRQLRQLLASNQYDGYLVTPNDEHGSEYVTERDRRLRFISGFAGSNGYALVLLDRAVLFTDGRYALQAELELDCNWWLVVGDEPLTDIHLWLRAHAPQGLKVATDARLMPLQSFDYLETQLRPLDIEFALISQDLVDVVWSNSLDGGQLSKPAGQEQALFVLPSQFTGNQSWQDKVGRVATAMGELEGRHYIVSQLDDIAWLLNLRGADIPMSPLFKAYLLISRQPAEATPAASEPAKPKVPAEPQLLPAPPVLQVPIQSQSVKVTLYVDLKKVTQQVRDHLQLENATSQRPAVGPRDSSGTRIQLELKDYEVFIMDIRDKLARQLPGKLLLNAAANVAIHVLAKQHEQRLVLGESLIQRLKAVKSEAEVQGMRLAHWRDSLAICMLLAQLELDIGQRGLVARWSEVGAASELEFYRSLMDFNQGQSFDTISAYGPNAAVVHYKPSEEPSGRRVFIGNLSTYLLDSGGQYLDGTTDITRTLHFGRPSELQRETYTRVLMGAIDMMSLVFEQPAARSPPYRLNDLIARRHLLEIGLDYKHGTGHGIGLFSLVHEAPALIEHFATVAGQRQAAAARPRDAHPAPPTHSEPVSLQPNMFSSVEPGYYRANEFGIRLENIVVTQRQQVVGEQTRLLSFEPISLVPFEPKLMRLELLSNKQKAWLNSYNLMVRLRLTQQINLYLARLREPAQRAGRLASRPSEPAAGNAGQLNYLRLEPAAFQEKLELAHRWILAKTELVPLDIPQALMVGRAAPASQPAEQQLDAQRLLLAYMSAAPFNDAHSAELMGQLGARAAANSSGEQVAACTGRYDCDLLLLDALGPAGSGAAQRARRLAGPAREPAAELDDPAHWLPELFQLAGPARAAFPLTGWSLACLAGLLLVQLAVATYVCRSRRQTRPPRAQRRPPPTLPVVASVRTEAL